jgi:CBS domain-containing membrane protein
MTSLKDPPAAAADVQRFRLFNPILAGATLRDRLIGCAGALLGITLTGLICGYMLGENPDLPLIIAPIGASAVLLFAVPASPLAQPWPVIGGNVISAAVGMIVAYLIDDTAFAVGLSVAAAIAIMSLTRSLHPPGGAVALTAALGGASVNEWGALFPFVPVGLNSCLLIAIGVAFHRLGGRAYPHKVAAGPTNQHQTRDVPASVRVGFNSNDVEAALVALDETFDIDPGDLSRLLKRVELEALLRAHGEVACSDVMSSDVIHATVDASAEEALQLLLKHNIRTLPIIEEGKLLGTVGLRELIGGGTIRANVTSAMTAFPDDRVMELLPLLTDGVSHAVVVVDKQRHLVGIISQTDMLAAVSRMLLGSAVAANDSGRLPPGLQV